MKCCCNVAGILVEMLRRCSCYLLSLSVRPGSSTLIAQPSGVVGGCVGGVFGGRVRGGPVYPSCSSPTKQERNWYEKTKFHLSFLRQYTLPKSAVRFSLGKTICGQC